MRDEKCRVPDTDGFLRNSIQGFKQTLAKAFIEHHTSGLGHRERRQIGRGKIARLLRKS